MFEKQRQEQFPWERTKYSTDYNAVLARYMYIDTLEYIRGESLLDLACGDGHITSMFANHFQHVVGVDASPTHLIEARKRVHNGTFYESLIEDFDPKTTFDTVLFLNVLEHVIDPVAILRKVSTFLSENGVLIIHVPNAEAINRKIAVSMGTLNTLEELSPFDINVVGHRRSYTLDTLCDDIHAAGLNVVKTGGVFFKMLSTAQMDWFLKNGLWEEGGFGWGRVGEEKSKDWRNEFCRACYEIGKERPRDCNVVTAVVTK